ncbi:MULTISPECIES: class III lanthipeptide [unclassified Streptomyces]
MANILDLQALELPQEQTEAGPLNSTQSNHCDDTSSISLFC